MVWLAQKLKGSVKIYTTCLLLKGKANSKLQIFPPKLLKETLQRRELPKHPLAPNNKRHKRIGFEGKERKEYYFQVLQSKQKQNWPQVCFASSAVFNASQQEATHSQNAQISLQNKGPKY